MTDNHRPIEIEIGGETIDVEVAAEIVDLYENGVKPELDEPMAFERLAGDVLRSNAPNVAAGIEQRVLDLNDQVRRRRHQQRRQARQAETAAGGADGE